RQLTIDTGRYYVLASITPFVNICLQSTKINPDEFSKIVNLAAHYQNDPRMIDMVRMGGDASAKVPYLMDAGETADSILTILREIAQPHVKRLQSLPAQVQATIHLLLSLNTVPKGCEMVAIPALLEIDQIQGDMVKTLDDLMNGRQLAKDFHNGNITALQMLDRDWPRLREEKSSLWHKKLLPEKAQMQYIPFFDKADRLVYVHEICVIVDSPDVHKLQALTPPVLQRPLPANVPVPTTGSADWLIREVGKIGRHLTRALLEITKAHLDAERVALEARNYDLINQKAQGAFREFIEKTP
ncbi:MAG: hypothetical protein ABSF99_06215, partial [Anaerolineales bacterium]